MVRTAQHEAELSVMQALKNPEADAYQLAHELRAMEEVTNAFYAVMQEFIHNARTD